MISSPALWWPHDHGKPDLYTFCVELIGSEEEILDSHRSRIGLRRVQLLMTPGQWDSSLKQVS